MDRDTIKEKIHYETNIRNSIFTLALVTSSGTIGIFFHLKTITEIILFVLGIILTCAFFNGVFKKEDEIEKLIELYERSKRYAFF